MKRGQKLTNPQGRRHSAVAERAIRRAGRGTPPRSHVIATCFSAQELAQFDRLRATLGMSRCAALRFLTLKTIALELGNRIYRAAQQGDGQGGDTFEKANGDGRG